MGLFKFRAKNMVVIIIAAAACASVAASITDNNEEIPQQSTEESGNHYREKMISKDLDLGSKSSLTIKSTNNTTTQGTETTTTSTKHEKKIVHRLIGGHVKHHRKEERREEKEGDLVTLSAGNGKEKSSTRREDDDEKKLLSQQVKEGKYGLIQNEIYSTTPKRPGVISYLGNPEVPRDTSRNFGGLEEEEIWLAENHLLVLRGGKFPSYENRPENNESPWSPIDDYEAPSRQVKIPARPKVPPPFPVQLTEGGPIQIIRANGSSSILNDTADYDEYADYPEGFFPGEAPFYPSPSNATTDSPNLGPMAIDKASTSGEPYLPPISGTVGPFYSSIPPGAVFLPPPNNRSDDYDEDDQSIYYPPPYSFYYQPQKNSTAVPPGPLVPGIILPPPPNFFAALEEEISTTTRPTTTTTMTTTTTTTVPEESTTYLPPRRKTIAKPLYKQRISTTTPTIPTSVVTSARTTTRTRPLTTKTIGKIKTRNYSTPRYVSETTTITIPTTTTPVTEKTTTLSQNEYYDVETDVENQLVDLGPPQRGEWTGIVSTTPVPLLAYFTTTSSPDEQTRSTEDFSPVHVEADIPAKNQASYYFYEEINGAGKSGSVSKTTQTPQVYFETSTVSPYYSIEPLTSQRQPKKQYYSVEMIPSEQTANDYETKLSSLVNTEANYHEFTAQESPRNQVKYNIEKIRSQSQQNLADNSHRYYQPASVKPYYTTQRPRFYYQAPENQHYDYRDERDLKSNPVYQYNYDTNDYAKQQRQQQQGYRSNQEIREESDVYVDYQQPSITGSQYYDYESRPIEKVQQKSPTRVPYSQRPQRPVYSTATTRPFQSIINTTPNPQHAYYTKQEEQLLDDVTKEYFTIFGKKLPEVGIQSTTPLYSQSVAGTTTETPITHIGNTYLPNSYNDNLPVHQVQRFKPPKVKVHYGDQTQRPYSLEGDTLVNYKHPLPPINPDAEFITVGEQPVANRGREAFVTEHVTPFRTSRPVATSYIPASTPRETYRGRYPVAPISLANDIAVNYRNPRPPINPDAEFIAPVQGQGNSGNRGGSYFAYKLPGNGGHFYFLTPQAISQRQDKDREYYYSKPINPRLIRRRRRGPAEG